MTDEQAMTDAKALAGSHYTCEDCWYSCPASGQCCNDNLGDECNCGYDTRVKFIATALAARERAVWEAAADMVEQDCFGDVSVDFAGITKEQHAHNLNQIELASKIRHKTERTR